MEWYLSGGTSGSGTGGSGTGTVPGLNVALNGNGWPPQSYWDTHASWDNYSMSAGEVFAYDGNYYVATKDISMTKAQAASGPSGVIYGWFSVQKFTGKTWTNNDFSSGSQISTAARGDCYQAADGSVYVYTDWWYLCEQSGGRCQPVV